MTGFLRAMGKKMQAPKCNQSYLMSLCHFYSFALACVVGICVSKEKIIFLKDKVAQWSLSY